MKKQITASEAGRMGYQAKLKKYGEEKTKELIKKASKLGVESRKINKQ